MKDLFAKKISCLKRSITSGMHLVLVLLLAALLTFSFVVDGKTPISSNLQNFISARMCNVHSCQKVLGRFGDPQSNMNWVSVLGLSLAYNSSCLPIGVFEGPKTSPH